MHLTIDQFHPVVEERDAIGNEIACLSAIFGELGCRTRIFAATAGGLYGLPVKRWSGSPDGDVLLLHYSHGSDLLPPPSRGRTRVFVIYHGITPARYMAGLAHELAVRSEQGLAELPRLARLADGAVADSEFAAQDLRAAGFREVDVIPYPLNESLYQVETGEAVARSRNRLLVVGRVVPHKRIEDAVLVLDHLRAIGGDWRLRVVGSAWGGEVYKHRLEWLVSELGLDAHVDFLGSVPQSDLLNEYRTASALLFTSEHEGFGVPLVEAMRLGLPIFAFADAAVPEVLGDAGVLFSCRDCPLVAETIRHVLSNESRLQALLERQSRRAECFSREAARARWRAWLERIQPR